MIVTPGMHLIAAACALALAVLVIYRHHFLTWWQYYVLAALLGVMLFMIPDTQWKQLFRASSPDWKITFAYGLGMLWLLIFWILPFIGPSSTRVLHRRITLLYLVSIPLAIPMALMLPDQDETSSVFWDIIGTGIGLLILEVVLLRVIVPIGWLSLPLALIVWGLVLAMPAFFPVSGWGIVTVMCALFWLPSFREWAPYTRPRWLPRIPPRPVAPPVAPRAGIGGARAFTLIELLIVVAILAIFSTSMVTGISTLHQLQRRQQDRRVALALAQDQLALLRAADALPAPGRHALDPGVTGNPAVRAGSITIETTTISTQLRQVTVALEVGDPDSTRTLSLTALLPERAAAPATEGAQP